MSDTPVRRIKSVEAKSAYRLSVSWERGQPIIIDLSDMVRRGGVFGHLADMAIFSAVRIGENNRTVEWPEPKDDLGYPVISIDADALYVKYRNQQDARKIGVLDSLVKGLRAVKMHPQTSRS